MLFRRLEIIDGLYNLYDFGRVLDVVGEDLCLIVFSLYLNHSFFSLNLSIAVTSSASMSILNTGIVTFINVP